MGAGERSAVREQAHLGIVDPRAEILNMLPLRIAPTELVMMVLFSWRRGDVAVAPVACTASGQQRNTEPRT